MSDDSTHNPAEPLPMAWRCLLLILAAWLLTPAPASAEPYTLTGETCGGLPKVAVETMDGVCIGLMLQNGGGLKLVKPRKIAQIAGQDAFLLTDMGGWNGNIGSLYLVERRGGAYAATRLRGKLNLPHQIIAGPGGRYYIGEAHRISTFRLDAKNRPVDWRIVVDGLPDLGDNLHPLTHFIFLENGDLLVNIGAATDSCGKEVKYGECRGRKAHGLLRRYPYLPASDAWSAEFEVYANGLRNSMALVRHRSGTILQAENGNDFKAAGSPYEEINIVERGGDYGWPYCHDNDAAHPDWGRTEECRGDGFARPWSLMPPHTAPLDMMYYTGDLLPALRGKLLIGWHGYRQYGHRLVAYAVDGEGRPLREPGASYTADPSAAEPWFSEKPYAPLGARGPVSRHLEVTTRWNRLPGVRPRGAPVGLLEAEDGSLLIVDDKNQAVLRLAPGDPWRPDPAAGAGKAVSFAQDPKLTGQAAPVLAGRCQECHEFLKGVPPGELAAAMTREGWLAMPLYESKLAAALESGKMPPENPLPESEQAAIRKWFFKLKPE